MSDSSYDNNLRRWFHLITIGIFALVYGLSSLTWQSLLMPLSIMTTVFVFFDLLRIHIPHLNWMIQDSFKFILRSHEFHSISAASWFLIASIINIIIFSKLVASLGFLYLAIGDPAASYFGIKWGKKKIGEKTWVGCLGFFLSCWLVGSLWFLFLTDFQYIWLLAGFPALMAALAERYLENMDDNFSIPLTTSSMATFLIFLSSFK